MPPVKPKEVKIPSGEKVQVFYINTLADAIGRTSQTVRKWEIAGIIPPSCFKDSYGRRMYTQEQIDAVVKVAEELRISQGRNLKNTAFGKKIKAEFVQINKKYMQGA